jgi:hypothetical protein
VHFVHGQPVRDARSIGRRQTFCVSFALEPPISDLQSQIDRLNAALQRWQQAEGDLQPLEDRLSTLTDRGAEILNRLAAADERQAHAVSEIEARLGEWQATERRLHQDSLERIRVLERTIEQEWRALRGMHEEPLRLLREQATALGETSVAAASLSLRGYERAEARLAALESDLRAQLTAISRDIHAALADVKAATAGAPALPPPAAAPFPLDRVMQIHDGLRDVAPGSSGISPGATVPAAAAAGPRVGPSLQLPAAAALSQRVDVLERELSEERQEAHDTAATTQKLRRDWRVAIAALVIVVIAAGVLGVRLQNALDDAARRAAAAEQQAADADREIAAARAETTAARDAALRAELVSNVLAAPDLVRFGLAGVGSTSASRGQVMWSRSNGLVVSASTLPAPAPGSEYHVWLLTPRQPVRAGKLAPDPGGRASLVTANPDVPQPVDGVAVTLESAATTSNIPVGVTVLTRAPAFEP